ncbi:gephyrin-like molybdotransferase Glp [Streptomyces xiaopingdaonensis]|uniref:molybdotransferase-like divisome protein Glp n=1 Tax=Streptomyces xiaopingdaonensis TaxID=1565415 RepID=UPI0003089D30|nr:gephyrin-like molybdotransferase Glp [Streptomyces xiaopingdaonensis]
MSRTWSVDEHLADILARVRPLEPIELPLPEAQGCVLVEDVEVPTALPPFDNSSMDGYAVRSADIADASEEKPTVLEVTGEVAAGSGALPTVTEGTAARIMTGAALPPGADAVVPVEWTDGGTGEGPAESMTAEEARGEVSVHRPADPGAHVRTRGSDVEPGASALTAGTVLGAPQLGLLAALGIATVRVRPRPRVVVLSTGAELVPPGEALGPGQIHDSNSYLLTAAARAAGAIPYRVGAVPDDPEEFRSTLEDQLIRADLVVTSGGVSVGAYDVVKDALNDWEFEPAASQEEDPAGEPPAAGVEFRRLAMQPGKPQGFGLIGPDRTPILTLPGNPVSAYVSFELFVRPALRTLSGLEPVQRPAVPARLECAEPLGSPEGKRQYLRGSYAPPSEGADIGTVRPEGGSSSHLVAALARADALIVLPEKVTRARPGEEFEVLLLEESGVPSR